MCVAVATITKLLVAMVEFIVRDRGSSNMEQPKAKA